MLASPSLLIATIFLTDEMPAMCWLAPEIPTAMYRSGVTTFPVSPTWFATGYHPRSHTARLAPTAPPSTSASSSSGLNPSGPPRPRPPLTTTFASSSRTPSAFAFPRWLLHYLRLARIVALRRLLGLRPDGCDLWRAVDDIPGSGASSVARALRQELVALYFKANAVHRDRRPEPLRQAWRHVPPHHCLSHQDHSGVHFSRDPDRDWHIRIALVLLENRVINHDHLARTERRRFLRQPFHARTEQGHGDRPAQPAADADQLRHD